jgi:hypothetical protein
LTLTSTALQVSCQCFQALFLFSSWDAFLYF